MHVCHQLQSSKKIFLSSVSCITQRHYGPRTPITGTRRPAVVSDLNDDYQYLCFQVFVLFFFPGRKHYKFLSKLFVSTVTLFGFQKSEVLTFNTF